MLAKECLEEVHSLLNAFDFSNYLSARNKLILAIAFDTGARNTEICTILEEDVRDNVILIHGKGNKERHVPVTPYLKKLLFKYQRIKSLYFANQNLQYGNLLLFKCTKIKMGSQPLAGSTTHL